MEMHLVHISSSIGRGGSAIQPREIKDGLVVVAFHFKVNIIIYIKGVIVSKGLPKTLLFNFEIWPS